MRNKFTGKKEAPPVYVPESALREPTPTTKKESAMSNNTQTQLFPKTDPATTQEYLSARASAFGARQVFNRAQRLLRAANKKANGLEARMFGRGRRK